MKKSIWFMEGLSSQRDILQAIRDEAPNITLIASHRKNRPEILACGHHSFTEPRDASGRIEFMSEVINKHHVGVVHVGRDCKWFELHRKEIESLGVKLVTGATSVHSMMLADDKYQFALAMKKLSLPVVESIQINTPTELLQAIKDRPFGDMEVCVKPVTGIYGFGFWRLDETADFMAPFDDPEARRTHPDFYLHALSLSKNEFNPLVLMPYLPGPERSVDMLVNDGEVLAAIGRQKVGPFQHLEMAGEAYELAIACAQNMKADGLVNVQTRNDVNGKPVLLEINMRPSGGLGYTTHSKVSLPALFAQWQLGTMTKEEIAHHAKTTFTPASVRSVTTVLPIN